MKVVIPQPVVDSGVNYLKENGFEVVIGNGSQDPEYLKEIIKDADGLLVRTAEYTADVLSAAKNLKAIGRFGVGVDNIDLDYCKAHGITVTIAAGANANAVAEHTIMFILMLSRKALVQDENMRNGNYNGRNTNMINDVIGKTVSILGFGRIGRLVAKKAHDGLDMKIVAYDPYVDPKTVPDYVTLVNDMYKCISMGDFVSVHMPATPEYDGLICNKFFDAMKPTAFVINCARGKLQNEPELCEALKAHKIAGAALDVSRDEPNNINDELWHVRENLILSPHNAGVSKEASEQMALMAAQGIVSVLRGEKPEHPAPGF